MRILHPVQQAAGRERAWAWLKHLIPQYPPLVTHFHVHTPTSLHLLTVQLPLNLWEATFIQTTTETHIVPFCTVKATLQENTFRSYPGLLGPVSEMNGAFNNKDLLSTSGDYWGHNSSLYCFGSLTPLNDDLKGSF